MARISTYGIDAKPELGDKVIGTDQGANQATKNYTLGEISDLINNTNSLGVADQAVFAFQWDLSQGRDPGTISFASGGGNNTSFGNITSILLSKTGAGGKDIKNFLPLFAGKDIIIAESGDVNKFGHYHVVSIVDYVPDTNFLEVTLTCYVHNGNILKDKHYIFSEFVNPASNAGDKHFTYTQLSASSTWSITHNLDKFPSVSIVDSGNNVVIGDIQYTNTNELTITFNASFSGKAYLN